MIKFIAVKERETQKWYIVGQTEWTTEEYYAKPWSKRRSKRGVQKSYVIPKPERVSPFIECHQIIEANTKEEAEWLVSTWK